MVTLSSVLINFFRHFHHNSISRKNDHKQRFFFKLRHSKWQNCCCCRIQSTKSSKERGASYGYFVRTVGHNLTAGQNVGTDVEEMNLGIIAQVKPVEQKKEKNKTTWPRALKQVGENPETANTFKQNAVIIILRQKRRARAKPWKSPLKIQTPLINHPWETWNPKIFWFWNEFFFIRL